VQIRHRSGDENEDRTIQRRAGELQLARFSRTRRKTERDALFERYLPLARSLAARYRHTSEPYDDLLQVASIGLLKALERYDPQRGHAFSSFAVPTILGELRRHLRDRTWSVHVPRDLQELSQRLTPVTDELSGELGRPPTIAELAERLGVDEEQVLDAREAGAAYSPASLDERVSTEEQSATRRELLGARGRRARHGGGRDPDRALSRSPAATQPDGAAPALREGPQAARDRRDHGVSQMHVSRLIRQSLEQLQAIAAAEHDAQTE
jgi:RNA polymerase sigma-B factor